ncbi:uncharacterized protein PAC_09291 [Phialocephala subalpina]|uniref:Uncharacterized protein n=1 Tax=Phialocephala subalpina TaxID=576137 RepID=A0A1L7X2Z9_9HELO|nr:uncharacterized protein PAC_09291 [Phialocephala subalpina]
MKKRPPSPGSNTKIQKLALHAQTSACTESATPPTSSYTHPAITSRSAMAPTKAQITRFATLKSKLCAILREQVRKAYEEAEERGQDGNQWKWGCGLLQGWRTTSSYTHPAITSRSAMAPTKAQITRFATLKSKLCAILREQVRKAYEEAEERGQDGNQWKWGCGLLQGWRRAEPEDVSHVGRGLRLKRIIPKSVPACRVRR